MQLENLHKIECLGEQVNPLYYCKESGKLYRHKIYTPQGHPLKFDKLREIKDTIGRGYLYVRVNGKNIRVHQVVAMEFHNHKPDGMQVVVDHIDGDKLNNRIDNLQLVSARANIAKGKKHTDKTSELPLNVYWHERAQKFQVQFRFNGKTVNFGYYGTLEAAVVARDEVQTRLVENKEPLETFKSRLVTAKRFSY